MPRGLFFSFVFISNHLEHSNKSKQLVRTLATLRWFHMCAVTIQLFVCSSNGHAVLRGVVVSGGVGAVRSDPAAAGGFRPRPARPEQEVQELRNRCDLNRISPVCSSSLTTSLCCMFACIFIYIYIYIAQERLIQVEAR